MAADAKRKASPEEDAKHDAFLERIRDIRNKRNQKMDVVIIVIRRGICERYHLSIRKASQRFLDAQRVGIRDRITSICLEEGIELLPITEDNLYGNCYMELPISSSSDYVSNPGEKVYIWFDDN